MFCSQIFSPQTILSSELLVYVGKVIKITLSPIPNKTIQKTPNFDLNYISSNSTWLDMFIAIIIIVFCIMH